MKKKMMAVTVGLACLLALAGCAESPALAGLQVAGQVPVLAPGQSAPVQLSYSFTTEAPTEEQIAAALEQVTLVWASSDEAVATVDAAGVVTAVAPGNCAVTVADSEGLYSAGLAVVVVQPLEGATVQDEVVLDLGAVLYADTSRSEVEPAPGEQGEPLRGAGLAGETAVLAVAVQPANATGVTITYASSDEAVVAVAADGTLTPLAEGEAVVTTTVTGDGLDGPVELVLTTRVTVKLLPQGIALESTEGLLYVGYSTTLVAHTLPQEAPETAYSFASSDEAVATVDESGTVRAAGVGACTLTVTSAEGHTAQYQLTVVAAPKPSTGGGKSGGTTGGNTGDTGGATEGGGGDAGGGGGTYYPPGSRENPINGGTFIPEEIPWPDPTTNGWEGGAW